MQKNFLKTLYFIKGLLSIFLGLFSYYTYLHTRSDSILILSFTSFISLASAILGVVGCFKGIEDLKYRHLILAGEKEGIGKNFLMGSFSLMLWGLTLYLVFGSHALFYSERSQAYLQAYYHTNPMSFEEYYGKSLEDIERWGLLLITICGYAAYLITLVIIMITYFAYLLSLLYDSIDRVFEILNLNIMNLGLGMIYITVYCIEYHSSLKFEVSIPKNIPYAIIDVGIMLCLICALGFCIIKSQTINWLKLYVLFNFFMIFVCALCSTISVKSTHLFKEGLNEKCFDFMAIVSEDYIADLGCSNKYLNITFEENNICSKGQNRYIWEPDSINQGFFGCLNSYCCDVLVTDAKTKFDYLGICAGAAIVLICISLWACFYIWKKITHPELANRRSVDYKIWLWAVFSPILTIFSIIYFIPATPYLPSYLDTDVVVSYATVIDSRFFNTSWGYTGLTLNSFTNKKCSSCDKSEYLAVIVGHNGEPDEFEIVANDLDKIEETLNKFKFLPVCPGSDHYWDISLYRRDYYNVSYSDTLM